MIKDAVDILNERIYALLDENTILKEREDGLNHALKLAEAEIDRLRKALEEILKVYSPSPVKTYQTMEDIAKQALKQEKQNDY